jgi:hypothetical protein
MPQEDNKNEKRTMQKVYLSPPRFFLKD